MTRGDSKEETRRERENEFPCGEAGSPREDIGFYPEWAGNPWLGRELAVF